MITELKHYGILGMHWGIRRYQNPDGTLTEAGKARQNRELANEARKDAKRYADAKMYYGEGAGTRRKLLKGELSKKMANAEYKRAFDEALSGVDLSKSASKAIRERKARDTASTIKRGAKKAAAIIAAVAPFAASIYYTNNQAKVDNFVSSVMNKVEKTIRKKFS